VLTANPAQVQQYLSGKEAVARWLMGQVMKATRGQANPQVVSRLLAEKLQARRGSAESGEEDSDSR